MSRFTTRRSKESPMDFEYTSEEQRPPPVWSKDYDNSEPPRKRLYLTSSIQYTAKFANHKYFIIGTFSDMTSSGFKPVLTIPQPARNTPPPFAQSPTNTPFLFHTPTKSTPPPNLFWKPPTDFSPSKAFPSTASPAQEVADISMDDQNSSPLASKTQKRYENDQNENLAVVPTRKVSTSAVKRVYRERQRARSRGSRRQGILEEEEEESTTDEYSGDENQLNRNESITSNHHYTFNMPGIPADRSEVPYMLLGCVARSVTFSI